MNHVKFEFVKCSQELVPESEIMQVYLQNTLQHEYELHCQLSDMVGHKPATPAQYVEQFMKIYKAVDSE